MTEEATARRVSSRQASMELVQPPPEDIDDPSTRFLYVPHTITGLLIGGGCRGSRFSLLVELCRPDC
jgi:hypothetical protein